MSARDFAVVLLRVLGIYLVAIGISYVASGIAFAYTIEPLAGVRGPQQPQAVNGLATAVAGGAAWALVGLYLLAATHHATRWCFKDLPTTGRDLDGLSFQAVAIAVVGLYLASAAAGTIAIALGRVIVTFRGGNTAAVSTFVATNWQSLLEPVISMAIGLGLFFGSAGIARRWHRLQSVQEASRPAP